MIDGKEIRSRVTCAAAIAALALSLVNIGMSHAGAATTTPETDKAYGVINEDGTAKAGINSIADVKDNMRTSGADFVYDIDGDDQGEIVLSPEDIHNLLDVSYTADARLERSVNDLKTSTESTYAKKTEIPSLTGYATQTWVNNKGYLTNSSLSNYYTKAQVDAKIAANGSGSGSSSSNTLSTSYGYANLNTTATYTLNELYATFVDNTSSFGADTYKGYLVFRGASPSSGSCMGYFYGVHKEGGIYSGVYIHHADTKTANSKNVTETKVAEVNYNASIITNGDTMKFTLCAPV